MATTTREPSDNERDPRLAKVDFDMLAYDIADTINRGEYPIDLSATDIKPSLAALLIEALDRQTERR